MNRSEEDKIFENLDIDQAHKEANRLLKRDAIDPEKFRDIYGADVDKDISYVKEMEEKFKKELTPEMEKVQKIATIFEAIIYENVEQSEWLGPAETFKTSRYDDIKNGVDTIAKFQEDETTTSYLALAIDVTFSSDTEKKFARIKDEIMNGKMAEIKYLEKNKELPKIPRVIIGAETKTIKRLAELWMEKKENWEKLGKHQIQFQILEEILLQLETFADFARRHNKSEIASIYEQRYALVKRIYDEKRITLNDNGERDNVFGDIERNLKMFI
ncbi:MAG: hypothetical protein QMD50_03555 [Patescibacteria group bacterium]|nr:hypothetical protein [Patescibacteria group bacterium]